MRRQVGYIAGPALALLIMVLPLSLEPRAHALSAIMTLVVIWWICEVIPLAATSLMGVALLVLFDVTDPTTAFSPFAHPLIFLFLGGFILARAMSVHRLDKRLALEILTHRLIAGKPERSLIALLGTSFFLSMWISNTATAAMMLPITLGLMSTLFQEGAPNEDRLLIAVAYSASIGGIATPVGSPPNVIALGMMEKLLGTRPSFLEWMMVCLPLALICVTVLWFWIRPKLPPLPSSINVDEIKELKKNMGPLSRSGKNVIFALLVAVFLWVGPGLLAVFFGKDDGLYLWLTTHLPEAVTAILAAVLLFLLPGSHGQPTLEWKDAVRIDWSSLLLFGGGISLGTQMFDTGLAALIGKELIALTGGGAHPWLFILVCTYFTIFFTETTSNTASANLLIPLVIASSLQVGMDPLIPTLAVALSCSLAFMLPVSTPPNAIMYGSERVRLTEMVRMGFMMNMFSGVVILVGMRVLSLLIR